MDFVRDLFLILSPPSARPISDYSCHTELAVRPFSRVLCEPGLIHLLLVADSGHGMPRAPLWYVATLQALQRLLTASNYSGHLLASLIHHPLRQTTSTAAHPFTLPAWFPRHLLTTFDGKGRGDTRLAEEGDAGAKRREKGWVWVRDASGRAEKGAANL